MQLFLRRLLLALGAVGLLALAGCQTTPQDSSVPWNKPADWEGQLPGIGP